MSEGMIISLFYPIDLIIGFIILMAINTAYINVTTKYPLSPKQLSEMLH